MLLNEPLNPLKIPTRPLVIPDTVLDTMLVKLLVICSTDTLMPLNTPRIPFNDALRLVVTVLRVTLIVLITTDKLVVIELVIDMTTSLIPLIVPSMDTKSVFNVDEIGFSDVVTTEAIEAVTL